MTPEEKANKYAEETILAVYSDSELMQDFVKKQKKYAKVDFIAGYNEGQSNPKIKQLEWEDNFKETRWHCNLSIGFYIIDTVLKYEPYRVRFYLSEYDYPKYERFCKTIEEAMMYAQADFETRVKECLITE